jgi:hypothetical protein
MNVVMRLGHWLTCKRVGFIMLEIVCMYCVVVMLLLTEVEGQLLLSQCGSMKAVLCTHQRYVYEHMHSIEYMKIAYIY